MSKWLDVSDVSRCIPLHLSKRLGGVQVLSNQLISQNIVYRRVEG